MHVVALPAEDRVRFDAKRDVEIAGLSAISASVALARHANPGVVGKTARNLHGQRLRAHLHLLPAARRTRRLALTAGAAARRARLGEDHVPARRLDRARAVTLRTT